MMKKWSTTIIGVGLLLALVVSAAAQVGVVAGKVQNKDGKPIAGLTVSLVQTGAGGKTVTNAAGMFTFDNVPLRDTPYYLEVYWGSQLMYRQPITVRGKVNLPPIIL